ncbi:zinc-binding dehydrogenase [Bosea sp. (in: a-proteobacteria)]|uniref:zinc-binding dehydrogenase n=1 Tax=Bosea sp. (in: a-proteobacteria) TaxID=1871050 RepID=UPI0031FF2806
MAIGTAGYTAALCVDAIEDRGSIRPGNGEVLVTGAAGGVGSTAIALLAARGYAVTAATGRPETHDYLRGLGASAFVERTALAEKGAPLQKERWSGAVDAVGSQTLATVLSQTRYGAAVTACGLAGGADLPATVLPHILRGVALIGVDSVMAACQVRTCLGAAGAQPRPRRPARHQPDRADVAPAGAGRADRRRPGPRPRSRRRLALKRRLSPPTESPQGPSTSPPRHDRRGRRGCG